MTDTDLSNSETDLEWLAWRRNGIGASDAPAIAGLSPFASPWSVWANKVGLVADWDGNDSTQFGLDLEPVIAKWFHRETGLYVHGAQARRTHDRYTWARATLDGFVLEPGDDDIDLAVGVFEAKYTGDSWDEPPAHYVAQCQWQMFVTGLDRAWLAVMHLPFGRPRFAVHEIERDNLAIADLFEHGDAFWADHVVTGHMPPTDATRATTEAIRAVYGTEAVADETVDLDDIANLIARLRGCKVNAAQLNRDITALENQIKVRLGTATEGFVGDELAVTWRAQTRTDIDKAALREHEPDIARSFTRDSTFRVLRLKETTS